MNILVCMKAVQEMAEVRNGAQIQLIRDRASLQWNPADESALEIAVRLKGEDGAVTVLSMGPRKLEQALRNLFARGADEAILLSDPQLAGSDTWATAKTLSAAVRILGDFDLILCGRRAIDGETGQVPGMLAAALERPCITDVEKIEQGICHRRLETGVQILRFTAPAVLSLCEYSYPLRLPSILAMRRAKNKAVRILGVQELGLSPEETGLRGSFTRVVRTETTFPGLRKGPNERDPDIFCKKLLELCKEVHRDA